MAMMNIHTAKVYKTKAGLAGKVFAITQDAINYGTYAEMGSGATTSVMVQSLLHGKPSPTGLQLSANESACEPPLV